MPCFDDIENENLDACINSEIAAGISEVGVYYCIHSQTLVIPSLPDANDPTASLEDLVTMTDPITFPATKGWAKIALQPNTGEVNGDLVGNPGNLKDKQAFSYSVAGNDKKTLGWSRRYKNVPMLFIATERDGQKRLIGNKHNPAYITEGKSTTGKGGEDDKIYNFVVSAYSPPIVYEGVITLDTPST